MAPGVGRENARPEGCCPTCGRLAGPHGNPGWPFCTVGCQRVDLGRWLDERHRLPATPWEGVDRDPARSSDRDRR